MKARRNQSQSSKVSSRETSRSTLVHNSYGRIKHGLKKSNPAAIVVWAFHKLPSSNGLTARRVINFLKRHFKVSDNPAKTGKSFGAMIKSAVEFGLLKKRGNKLFLAGKKYSE